MFFRSTTRQAVGKTFPAFLANVNYLHNHLERQHPHALLLGEKDVLVWTDSNEQSTRRAVLVI